MEFWLAALGALLAAVAGAYCARAAKERDSMPLLVTAAALALVCLGLVIYLAITLFFIKSIP